MLLKNKPIILSLILILITPIIYAQMCEVAHVKNNLRNALYEYFENPSAARMELGKIKDLLDFYLTIPSGEDNVDCSGSGANSGVSYYIIVEEADSVTTAIPRCSDGTEFGTCSANKPSYCYNGRLVNRCPICGCSLTKICQSDGSCIATEPPANITNQTQPTNVTNQTEPPAYTETCIDSDGGLAYYTKGTATVYDSSGNIDNQGTDRCVASSTVAGAWQHFYILDEVGCYYPEGKPSIYGKFYDCPSGCENGVCQANATNTTQTCNIDSDCGADAYTGYYCQNNDVYGNHRAFSCINPGTLDSYCSSYVGSALVDDCADNESCFEGDSSCKSGEARTCIDSDGGKDYYAKGTTSWSFGSQWWNSTDYCMGTYLNEPSDKRVAEHYCPGGAVEYYECPNSCAYGACVR